jgi:hypothetical protein
MMNYLKEKAKYILTIAFALTPCIASMYLIYWLDISETWIPQTPHRDKITIVILGSGLVLSFFLQTYISKRNQK